jgi:tetratricopeptide (TPR) repeat protein
MGLFDRWRNPQAWAERQMDRAMTALEARKPATTLRIAASLHRMSFSGAFELEARAHEALGDLPKAIATAEAGVKQFGRSARLWNVLGTLYSRDGRFDRAIKALERALRCEGVDAANVRYNQAVAMWRAGRPDEALESLQAIHTDDTDLGLSVLALQMAILNDQQRWDEAITVGERLPQPGPDDPVVDLSRGRALAQLARAWWHGRSDGERARSMAIEAVEADRKNYPALEIIRLIDDRRSDGAMVGMLCVKGTWPTPMGRRNKPHAFMREFQVVARNADEALAFAKVFLPPGSLAGITVESWDPEGAAPADRLGVYDSTGYGLFPL